MVTGGLASLAGEIRGGTDAQAARNGKQMARSALASLGRKWVIAAG
ncbi:hypothetical protein RCO27_04385 [Sphingosinicella sp. LHD-64]|nr:hypothetical protein [Sphingosinicella sp. LHD-64]MDQ8755460.1 hypothetical protein [Sphingosinicella sp. LHD-64]